MSKMKEIDIKIKELCETCGSVGWRCQECTMELSVKDKNGNEIKVRVKSGIIQ